MREMMENSNGETKKTIQRLVWGMLTLTVGGVISMGTYLYNDLKVYQVNNIRNIEKGTDDVRIIREEQIKRSARLTQLEERVKAMEQRVVEFERQYRGCYKYNQREVE